MCSLYIQIDTGTTWVLIFFSGNKELVCINNHQQHMYAPSNNILSMLTHTHTQTRLDNAWPDVCARRHTLWSVSNNNNYSFRLYTAHARTHNPTHTHTFKRVYSDFILEYQVYCVPLMLVCGRILSAFRLLGPLRFFFTRFGRVACFHSLQVPECNPTRGLNGNSVNCYVLSASGMNHSALHNVLDWYFEFRLVLCVHVVWSNSLNY